MPSKLNVYNLGALGVNVDANPLELQDGELSKAQNGVHDVIGSAGGLRKRKGLIKLNSVAAVGSIKGAIGVPISQGTAGNPSPAVTAATTTFYAGRRITSTTAGWNVSTNAFGAAVTTGGPDGYDAAATPRVPDYVWGHATDALQDRRKAFGGKPSCMYKNRFYYAGNDYTLGVSSPTIRMYDGNRDYLMANVPSRSGTVAQAVFNMVAANDQIYIITYDSGTSGGSTLKSSVYQMDPENGVILLLGTRFPQSGKTRIPWTVGWSAKRIWAKTFSQESGDLFTYTYSIRPGIDADWTVERSVADGGSLGDASCINMLTYQGQLYFAGSASYAAGVGVVGANVLVRSTLGVYSVSKVALLNEGGAVPLMSDFGDWNHFGGMAVFNGNLYVAYFNFNIATTNRYSRIYKYDGSSWTVVYSPAANAATSVPFTDALVVNGKLYFVSGPTHNAVAGVINAIISSPDGTTWSDVSSGLTGTSQGAFGAISL